MNATTTPVIAFKDRFWKAPCPKCSAKGHIRGFSHVANGVCFMCGGSKVFKGIQRGRGIVHRHGMVDFEVGYEGRSFGLREAGAPKGSTWAGLLDKSRAQLLDLIHNDLDCLVRLGADETVDVLGVDFNLMHAAICLVSIKDASVTTRAADYLEHFGVTGARLLLDRYMMEFAAALATAGVTHSSKW